MGSLPVDFAEIKPEDYWTAIHCQPAFCFGERCSPDTLSRSSVARPVWDQRPRRSSARPPESPGTRVICTSHLRRFFSKRAWNPPSLIRQLGYVHRRTSVCYAMRRPCRGVAQSGLARLLWEQEVAGSNPAAPTMYDSSGPWFARVSHWPFLCKNGQSVTNGVAHDPVSSMRIWPVNGLSVWRNAPWQPSTAKVSPALGISCTERMASGYIAVWARRACARRNPQNVAQGRVYNHRTKRLVQDKNWFRECH